MSTVPWKNKQQPKNPLPKWSVTTEKYSQGNKGILCLKRTCTKCRGWNKAWIFYFLQSSSHYFNRQRITKQQNFDGSTYFPHTLSVRGLFRERPNNLWHLSQRARIRCFWLRRLFLPLPWPHFVTLAKRFICSSPGFKNKDWAT